jgi:hypothetical protein
MIWVALLLAAAINLGGSILVLIGSRTNRRTALILSGLVPLSGGGARLDEEEE